MRKVVVHLELSSWKSIIHQSLFLSWYLVSMSQVTWDINIKSLQRAYLRANTPISNSDFWSESEQRHPLVVFGDYTAICEARRRHLRGQFLSATYCAEVGSSCAAQSSTSDTRNQNSNLKPWCEEEQRLQGWRLKVRKLSQLSTGAENIGKGQNRATYCSLDNVFEPKKTRRQLIISRNTLSMV